MDGARERVFRRSDPGCRSGALPGPEPTVRARVIGGNEDQKKLYFCSATFVRTVRSPKPKKVASKKIKCVVWDLDNTLWDGVLIEGTAGAVPKLKEGIRSTLEELDRRGILLSVASKNSEEDARKALEALGVWDFSRAQIHWQPEWFDCAGGAKTESGLIFAFVTINFRRDEWRPRCRR